MSMRFGRRSTLDSGSSIISRPTPADCIPDVAFKPSKPRICTSRTAGTSPSYPFMPVRCHSFLLVMRGATASSSQRKISTVNKLNSKIQTCKKTFSIIMKNVMEDEAMSAKKLKKIAVTIGFKADNTPIKKAFMAVQRPRQKAAQSDGWKAMAHRRSRPTYSPWVVGPPAG